MKSSNTISKNCFGGLLAALFMLLSISAAHAQIYVTELGIPSFIGEYNTNGSTVNASLISSSLSPEGIAISGSDIFVANYDGTPFGASISEYTASGTVVNSSLITYGGLPPLHDNHRSADVDNPRGYFEFAPAKNIRMDDSWMPHAGGRALKLVAQLLPYLPPNHEYRIILMERSLEEVLFSQKVMLDRHGRKGAAISSEKLRAAYEEQLLRVTEVLERRKLPVLRVSHHEAIRDPEGVAKRVVDFLRLPLDRAAMAIAIDPSLHRQRSLSKPSAEARSRTHKA